jgi:hypothetical protein
MTDRISTEFLDGWLVKLSDDAHDTHRSFTEFLQLCDGRLPAAGSQLAFFLFDRVTFTIIETIYEGEATNVAGMLSKWCERIGRKLQSLSTSSKKAIMIHAITTALPNKCSFINVPSLLLVHDPDGEPCVQITIPIINIDSYKLADALHKDLVSNYDFSVKPASLVDEVVVPAPHPAFCITVTNELDEWKPDPNAKHRQPTKAQMNNAILITKYIAVEVLTKATTYAEAACIAEDIKCRYLLGVEMQSYLNRPLPLYKGNALFEIQKADVGKRHVMVPSQVVQDDIHGKLPDIPITLNSASSEKICNAIEDIWSETSNLVAAWEAGCRRYGSNRLRPGIGYY